MQNLNIKHLGNAVQFSTGNHILVVEDNGSWNAYTHGMDALVKISGSNWQADKGIEFSTVGCSGTTAAQIMADLQSAQAAAEAFTAIVNPRNK